MNAGDDLVVPASHPMLAGHFPGEPIVPGAWLLAAVQCRAERWLHAHQSPPARVTGVRVAKFTRPVRPDETCRVTFAAAAAGLRFTVRHGEAVCASGTLLLDGPRDGSLDGPRDGSLDGPRDGSPGAPAGAGPRG